MELGVLKEVKFSGEQIDSSSSENSSTEIFATSSSSPVDIIFSKIGGSDLQAKIIIF
jgi:hypothetical protein